MEGLFLLAGADLLIVVRDHTVRPGLFVVIPLESIVKQFVVDGLDILVAVFHIEVGTLRVGVLGVELSAVVVHRAAAHHDAYRSFQINTP